MQACAIDSSRSFSNDVLIASVHRAMPSIAVCGPRPQMLRLESSRARARSVQSHRAGWTKGRGSSAQGSQRPSKCPARDHRRCRREIWQRRSHGDRCGIPPDPRSNQCRGTFGFIFITTNLIRILLEYSACWIVRRLFPRCMKTDLDILAIAHAALAELVLSRRDP